MEIQSSGLERLDRIICKSCDSYTYPSTTSEKIANQQTLPKKPFKCIESVKWFERPPKGEACQSLFARLPKVILGLKEGKRNYKLSDCSH